MIMEKAFKENLINVLAAYQRALVDAAEREAAENPHVFSENFEENMRRIIRKEKKGYYKWFGTPARKLVATIIIAIIVMCSSVMSVKAAREAVIEFFTEIYEKFSVVFYDTEEEALNSRAISSDDSREISSDEVAYEPGYVQEGYQVYERKMTNSRVYYIKYVDGNNQTIIYEQRVVFAGETTIVDSENTSIQYVTVDGLEYRYLKDDDFVMLMWNQGLNAFVLKGTNLEELLKMAVSLEISDNF